MPLANYSTPPGYDSISIDSYRLFGGIWCLHLLGANSLDRAVSLKARLDAVYQYQSLYTILFSAKCGVVKMVKYFNG